MLIRARLDLCHKVVIIVVVVVVALSAVIVIITIIWFIYAVHRIRSDVFDSPLCSSVLWFACLSVRLNAYYYHRPR